MIRLALVAIRWLYCLMGVLIISGIREAEILMTVVVYDTWQPKRDLRFSAWERAAMIRDDFAGQPFFSGARPFSVLHLLAIAALLLLPVVVKRIATVQRIPIIITLAALLPGVELFREVHFHVGWWEYSCIAGAVASISCLTYGGFARPDGSNQVQHPDDHGA